MTGTGCLNALIRSDLDLTGLDLTEMRERPRAEPTLLALAAMKRAAPGG